MRLAAQRSRKYRARERERVSVRALARERGQEGGREGESARARSIDKSALSRVPVDARKCVDFLRAGMADLKIRRGDGLYERLLIGI